MSFVGHHKDVRSSSQLEIRDADVLRMTAQKEDEKEANKEEEKGKQASTSNGSTEVHLSDSAACPELAAALMPTTDGDHSTKVILRVSTPR